LTRLIFSLRGRRDIAIYKKLRKVAITALANPVNAEMHAL
jgi:hypothetical protein